MKLIWLILIFLKEVCLVKIDEEAKDALLMKVDLYFDDPVPVQLVNAYHPGCYDSYIYSGLRIGNTDVVINNIIRGNNLVYLGAETLANRRAVHTIPKPDLEIIEIVSYHFGLEEKYEYVELIKNIDVPYFVENVKQLVTVDLADVNALPLYVDTRSHDGGIFEIFISDIFKYWVMLGEIKYGPNLIESIFHNSIQRSVVFKPLGESKLSVRVTSFLKNGKRNKNYYEVDTEANIQGSVVKYDKTTTTYVGNLPEDLE
ncbi:uncharacterized protein TA02620 [Theileria annulata]|uniref:Uncharacterized protein n=1 Tax=Theileria annulata TaxID=5874 RepID=Q4UD27_THEAN|nr:uncharacterized protein TA02620 [Theileria annulata]CAI75274.1 hypothetical protein TA02620 [Theileria annulata]|eukprot:XP_954750.1 hypothetical protein TA02620 [Theileria annulata]